MFNPRDPDTWPEWLLAIVAIGGSFALLLFAALGIALIRLWQLLTFWDWRQNQRR